MPELVRPPGIEVLAQSPTGKLLAPTSSIVRPVSHEAGPPQLGWHLLCELYDCRRLPQTAEVIRAQMVRAAELIGATVVQAVFHEFNPYGLSGVVVIAESHLAVHTWPEHRCAAVDLFTCTPDLDPRPGMEFLSEAFQAGSWELIEVPRGGRIVRQWPLVESRDASH